MTQYGPQSDSTPGAHSPSHQIELRLGDVAKSEAPHFRVRVLCSLSYSSTDRIVEIVPTYMHKQSNGLRAGNDVGGETCAR